MRIDLNVMYDKRLSLVHCREGELSEDISKQFEVNEVHEGFEEHTNDGKNAHESATGQAGTPSKRKKADESAAEEGNSSSTLNKFLSTLEKKVNTLEDTGPKIN